MVQRGNEERCGGLGRLNVGGSNRGGNDGDGILRSPFYAFVVLNEAGVGRHECLKFGIRPCVVIGEVLTVAYPKCTQFSNLYTAVDAPAELLLLPLRR